jgi:hypothetical protein
MIMNKYARSLRLGALTLALAVFGGLVGVALGLPWASNASAGLPDGSLACSVKDFCDMEIGEVEVFRMSSTSNAHAGTPAGSGYGYSVCCGDVEGLGTNCSGHYDTVLRLSAADNAHVQSVGAYPKEVCLSADTAVVDCMFAGSCTGGYACLATASGTDNAHVADCDGPDPYATKVCCRTSVSGPVGGVAELPEVSESDSPARTYIALGGAGALAAVVLAAGAWYTRRRWLS